MKKHKEARERCTQMVTAQQYQHKQRSMKPSPYHWPIKHPHHRLDTCNKGLSKFFPNPSYLTCLLSALLSLCSSHLLIPNNTAAVLEPGKATNVCPAFRATAVVEGGRAQGQGTSGLERVVVGEERDLNCCEEIDASTARSIRQRHIRII